MVYKARRDLDDVAAAALFHLSDRELRQVEKSRPVDAEHHRVIKSPSLYCLKGFAILVIRRAGRRWQSSLAWAAGGPHEQGTAAVGQDTHPVDVPAPCFIDLHGDGAVAQRIALNCISGSCFGQRYQVLAGLRQFFQPSFTGREIFGLIGDDAQGAGASMHWPGRCVVRKLRYPSLGRGRGRAPAGASTGRRTDRSTPPTISAAAEGVGNHARFDRA